MPLSGGWAARFGCRRTILTALGATYLALPLLPLAPNTATLALLLLIFGGGIGTADVVMNIQALEVEKLTGKTMMSGFHGLYSFGGIIGAAVVTQLLAIGLSSAFALALVAGSVVSMVLVTRKGLLPSAGVAEGPPFALPRGRVVLLGVFCFILFLAEGSVVDWSGVLLNAVHQIPADRAGVGYVAFSIAMTVGRLTGDRVVAALGGIRVVLAGCILAGSGFLFAAWSPTPAGSIVGFTLVGIGAANIVPVFFTAAGNQTVMPTHLAVSAVTTMGYAGILVGPALLGFIAESTSLPLALSGLVAMLAFVALSATKTLQTKD